MRRRLRRRAAPRAARPASTPERIYMHGNAKSRGRAARGASRPASARSCVDNVDDIDRLERAARRPRQRVLLRVTPGVDADTHAAISTGQADSKFGFAPRDAPRAIERLAPRRARARRACTCTSARSSSTSSRTARRSRRSRRSATSPLYNLGGGLGVAYTAERPAAVDRGVRRRAWSRAAHELLGRGKRAADRAGPRARRQRRRDALHASSPSSAGRVAPGSAVDGGMSDNLRPMLYGARLRGRRRRPRRRGRATPCTRRRQALRVRRRARPRRARCDDPRPGDVLVDARRPAPTGTRWPTTTTASRARR